MVYTAEHPALAALEILTAWKQYLTLSGYFLYLVEVDPDAVENALPSLRGAGVDVLDAQATRRFGDAWLAERRSVALRVPSVVAPASYNYLLNPEHPDFEKGVARRGLGEFQYDERVMDLVRNAKGSPAAKEL